MGLVQAKTLALIFGIVNIITASLMLIVGIIALACDLRIVSPILMPGVPKDAVEVFFKSMLDLVGPPVIIFLCAISLIFSSFLVIGIRKRNAVFVRAYFVYSVVVPTLLAGVTIVVMITVACLHGGVQNYTPCIVTLVICVIFCLRIIVIVRTYKNFEYERL